MTVASYDELLVHVLLPLLLEDDPEPPPLPLPEPEPLPLLEPLPPEVSLQLQSLPIVMVMEPVTWFVPLLDDEPPLLELLPAGVFHA